MRSARTYRSLAVAAVLVACSSDGTGPEQPTVTLTGTWSAPFVPGTQINNPQMQLTENASGAVTGTVSYTATSGGGAGDLQYGGTVQGTRQSSTVTLSWNVPNDPRTFTGTLNGDILSGSLTSGPGTTQVTFQR